MADTFENAKKGAEEFKDSTAEAFAFLKNSFSSLSAQIASSFDGLIDSVDDLGDDIDKKIAKNIQRNVVSEVKKFNASISEGIKLNAKLATGALKYNDIQRARTNLLSKELELESLLASAEAEGIPLGEKTIESLNSQITLLEKEIELVEELNQAKEQALGVTGQSLNVLDGLLRKIGAQGLADALDIQGAINLNTKFDRETKSASVNLGGVFKSVGKNLLGSINATDLLIAGFKKLGEAAQAADKNIAEIRRNFGLSFNEARKLNDQFTGIAIRTLDVTATTENLAEANQSINNQLGIQTKFQDDLLVKTNQLIQRNKLSADAAASFAQQVLATGISAEELENTSAQTVANIQNQSGVQLSFNSILEEANTISGQLRVNLLRTPDGLVRAASVARTLGVEMANIASIAGKLLDFESSITAELEAELLLGRDLNLEQARYLALQGKSDEAVAELVKQVGTLEEFQRLNVIQQEALASAVGMTVDQLATTVEKQSAINSQKQEGLNIDAEAMKEGASALSIQEQLASAVTKLNSILQATSVIALGLIGAVTGFILGGPLGPLGALIGFIAGASTGALATGVIPTVQDGIASPNRGPFTITDNYGKTAVTTKGDGVVVSPNINQGSNNELKETNELLRQILTKQGTVKMNATDVGTAFSINTYEIQ